MVLVFHHLAYFTDNNQREGGKGEGDNEGKKEKDGQGICIKDPWTKPKRGRIEGGRWGWGRGKWWWLNGDNCT